MTNYCQQHEQNSRIWNYWYHTRLRAQWAEKAIIQKNVSSIFSLAGQSGHPSALPLSAAANADANIYLMNFSGLTNGMT